MTHALASRARLWIIVVILFSSSLTLFFVCISKATRRPPCGFGLPRISGQDGNLYQKAFYFSLFQLKNVPPHFFRNNELIETSILQPKTLSILVLSLSRRRLCICEGNYLDNYNYNIMEECYIRVYHEVSPDLRKQRFSN